MVDVDLLDQDGASLATSATPLMLQHSSILVDILYTLAFALPLVLGIARQQQTLVATYVVTQKHTPNKIKQ